MKRMKGKDMMAITHWGANIATDQARHPLLSIRHTPPRIAV
jgi:hypothetical protein